MAAGKEAVLWYCPDPVVSAAAKRALLAQGVKIHLVERDQMGRTVGSLFGLKGFSEEPAAQGLPAPAGPVLVLSGFTGARLDALLAAFKRAGVPRIGWKAVLTPTNVSWTFHALAEELEREHAALGG